MTPTVWGAEPETDPKFLLRDDDGSALRMFDIVALSGYNRHSEPRPRFSNWCFMSAVTFVPHPQRDARNMQLYDTITYGKLPYWMHNGHTACCVGRTDLPDGTADVQVHCSCGSDWNIAEGVDESEVPPEG